jgi:hypothetical protein
MDYKVEATIASVSDVDSALAFHSDKGGFRLDVDHGPSEDFRVVRLTLPESATRSRSALDD